MDLDLTDRRIVVTGASSGIGRATAKALAAEGAELVVCARRRHELDSLVVEATTLGAPGCTAVAADLSDAAGAGTLAAKAAESLGGVVDGLVCCVGATPLGSFVALDDQAWELAFTMKFLATVRSIRTMLPFLRASGGARVVVIGGNVGNEPNPEMTTSGVINAALNSLVGSLGRELAADGIGVVAVHPGPTRTARYDGLVAAVAARHGGDREAGERVVLAAIPRGQPARPVDVASSVSFLLSPVSAHVTGTSLTVDGGQTWVS